MPARRKPTKAARVWNRACFKDGGPLREGDEALAAVILLNGYIFNGGVGHAFDLEPQELDEGLKGLAYFGLHNLIAIIKPHAGEEEAEYNAKYYALEGRGGDCIYQAFEEMYSRHPERFAPLEDDERTSSAG